jgi:hypothetical protein
VTVFPTGVEAQTRAVSFDALQETTARNLDVSSEQAASQRISGGGLTRGDRIAIAAAIGGGIGAVVGEYLFGRALDMPHGPDMLLGAGLGATLGALSVALTESKSSPSTKSSVTVIPVFLPSRKSLLMRLTLR